MNILDFVMVGSNDHQKSGDFYDAVFEPLKLKRILKTEKYLGYAHSSDPDKVQFYVTHPVNGEPATFGNGSQTFCKFKIFIFNHTHCCIFSFTN